MLKRKPKWNHNWKNLNHLNYPFQQILLDPQLINHRKNLEQQKSNNKIFAQNFRKKSSKNALWQTKIVKNQCNLRRIFSSIAPT